MLMLVFSYKLKPVYDQIIKKKKKTDTLVDVFRYLRYGSCLYHLKKKKEKKGIVLFFSSTSSEQAALVMYFSFAVVALSLL